MKKTFALIASLIILNIALFAQTKYEASAPSYGYRSIASTEGIIEDLECIGGGTGSSDCSFSGGVGEAHFSCEVTCRDGYFACCGFGGCHCHPEVQYI